MRNSWTEEEIAILADLYGRIPYYNNYGGRRTCRQCALERRRKKA